MESEQYRKELLHQSFDLFAKKGYANVTTRQISNKLGLSTGALYHYFPSKKALFEQLVEEMSQQDIQMLKTATEGAKNLTERIEKLGEFLIANEKYLVKQAFVWVDFYQHSDFEGTLNPVFQRVEKQYQHAMAELLGISNLKVARFVWILINGVLIEQLSGDNTFLFLEQVDLLMKMLSAYFEKYPTL